MTTINKVILASLLGSSLAYGSTEIERPEITITKVRGYGSACPTDENGVPKNWAIDVNSDTNTFTVNYSGFRLSAKKPEASCKISLILAFPAGKTLFNYSSAFRGTASLKGNDSLELISNVKLGKSQKYVHKDVVTSDMSGDWETEVKKFEGSKDAPCGGKDYRVTIELSAKLKAKKKSRATINYTDGAVSDFTFTAKNCK